MTQATSPTAIDPALLEREQEHFDQHYADEAAQGIAVLSDYDQVRYTQPPANTIFPREYYYHLLGNLKGKSKYEGEVEGYLEYKIEGEGEHMGNLEVKGDLKSKIKHLQFLCI